VKCHDVVFRIVRLCKIDFSLNSAGCKVIYAWIHSCKDNLNNKFQA